MSPRFITVLEARHDLDLLMFGCDKLSNPYVAAFCQQS